MVWTLLFVGDTSEVGLGGILTQKGKRMVYALRKLKNYMIHDLSERTWFFCKSYGVTICMG